jgi:hypothetical protein
MVYKVRKEEPQKAREKIWGHRAHREALAGRDEEKIKLQDPTDRCLFFASARSQAVVTPFPTTFETFAAFAASVSRGGSTAGSGEPR